MSTGLISKITSTSSEQTEQLAASLGKHLRGGEVIQLVSDLGGGKTTFVRGLARGIGSKDRVSSPSFTLSNEYKTEKLTVYHFDFYRLAEAGIMRQELAEAIADKQAVTIVEWADIVEKVLPSAKLMVRIKAIGENEREISFEYPNELEYLMKEVA